MAETSYLFFPRMVTVSNMWARSRWVALLLAVTLLAGCGDPDATTEAATEAPPAASSPTSTTTDTEATDHDLGPSPESVDEVAPIPEPPETSGDLEAHFLDIGQGDATVLIGAGATILIDTGRHDRSDVVPALRSIGVQHLDLVIITHAHADHVGQLDSVLAELPVDEVWMSGTPHTTATFERAITALERSDAAYGEPRSGDVVELGDLLVEVFNPERLVGDHHADGVAVRVTHGAVRFLFTGDAEALTETAMVRRHGPSLRAEIYQVGHHGSRTSSNRDFLAAVQPDLAVYSAGAGNSYRHPHDEALTRLAAAGAETYGTPVHGTVIVRTDGTSWTVRTTRSEEPTPAPTTTAPARAPPPSDTVGSDGCSPGQVDINTASNTDLQRIIHIGPARADEVERMRPFSNVDNMTRINGIGSARIADITAEGIACATTR